MVTSAIWKSYFNNWPAGLPRNGVLVTSHNEAIPFRKYWLKEDLLLLERTAPDANGGRFLLLGFDTIFSVKFTSPIAEESIAKAGFVASDADRLMQTV